MYPTKLHEILRTTVFRLSLVYAGGFSALTIAGFALAYWLIAEHALKQVDDVLNAEAAELEEVYRTRGASAAVDAVKRRSAGAGRERLLYLIEQETDAEPMGDRALGSKTTTAEESGEFATVRISPGTVGEQTQMRILTRPLPEGGRLRIGHALHSKSAILEHAEFVVALSGGAVVIIALIGGVIMGLRVLRRIAGLNRATSDIVVGNLSARLPMSERCDEFDTLSENMNQMLDRIDRLVSGMREVTDNVAHDLRTPLGRLRSALEVSLLESRSEPEYRAAIERAIDQSDRLLRTFNGMLALAEIESGTREVDFEQVDLSALAADLADFYEDTAADRGLQFECDIETGVCVEGDWQLLAQAINNLLDNAVKFTPDGGCVSLSVRIPNGRPFVRVDDNGPGIPVEERMHVLGRFVRLDNARSTPGNGLGLSLVNAVADHHGAQLGLTGNEPGLGVEIEFPASSTVSRRAARYSTSRTVSQPRRSGKASMRTPPELASEPAHFD